MPPRHAYWTILIDDKPTAFRARDRDELQPTFVQLQRKNANVVMRWFARGKLWPSREAEHDDFVLQKQAASAPPARRRDTPAGTDRRGNDWRPGGAHKDPRDRFKKKNRPERAWSEKDPATQRDRDKPGYAAGAPRPPRPPRDDRQWRDKPRGDRPSTGKPPAAGSWGNKPRGDGKRPWSGKPGDRPGGAPGFRPDPTRGRKPWAGKPAPNNDRPWQTKPTGPRAQRKPWDGRPAGDRPWTGKPSGDRRPDNNRPWSGKPRGGKPGGFNAATPQGERKPWSGKAWSGKPPGAGERAPGHGGRFRPGSRRPDQRKRRDDEPPDKG